VSLLSASSESIDNAMPRDSLLSLFADFRRFPGDRAIVYPRGYRHSSWTYENLASFALLFANALKARGILAGDRILLWGANSAEWVAAFWGCLLSGAVAVPMDDSASPYFAARVVRDSHVKLVVASRSKPPLDTAIPVLVLEDLPDIAANHRVFVGKTVPRETPKPFSESMSAEPITRQHIAEILFTSGTTAEPRGVVLTHGNFLANLEPIERGMQPHRKYERVLHPLRFVSLVPLSHVFGQFMALFVPPLLGATVVFENSTNPAEILRTMKRERATLLIAVPRMLELLRSAMEREIDSRGWRGWFDKNYAAAETQPFLRRAWRFRRIHRLLGFRFWAFISGGAALGSDTELFFKRIGFAVVQGYGMTETASLISLNHPFSAAEGSVGKILPGREFKLAEDGEILVRGENVSSGYWEKGSLQQSSQENNGWLRTGDLGELDANGNLKFRGRKKNVIVTSAGLNIHPEDLEAALKKQLAIRDAVVVPLNRNSNPEPCAVLLATDQNIVIPSTQPAVFVGSESRNLSSAPTSTAHQADRQLSSPTSLTSSTSSTPSTSIAAAITAANSTLAGYQKIRTWFIWPEPDFPRTPTGKPRLATIAAHAAKLLNLPVGAGPVYPGLPGASAAPASTAADPLAKFLSSTSFTSLSSLDRVELLSTLEHRYNVEIDESAFSQANSISDLQKLIARPASQHNAETKNSDTYNYPHWTQRGPVRLARLIIYYLLVWPATQLLAHPRVIGQHHLQNLKGPAIIISNHITRRADIGLILAALPARFRHRLATAMGGESLRRMRIPPREWFFAKRRAYQLGYFLVTALFNVFPLPQFSGLRQSFRFAGESADRGYSVLVFPEGVVNNSADGRMAPFQSGIGLLAENLALPIIPMRLDGLWQMKKEKRRLARLGEITVHIGAPVTFPPNTPANEIARHLQYAVQCL
jgi:long-chain acyl-CoA synthetase